MELISHYKIFHNKRFVVEYHEGVGTLEEVKTFKIKEANDPSYSPDFDLLMDIRKVTIKGIKNDVKEYIEFANSHQGISGHRKLAVITNTPRQVIFFAFLNMFKMKLPQIMKIFSSVEAALLWLGEPISLEDMDSCLNNLKDKAKSYL
ncbi:hypothetical protein DWB61_08090 [Ancylomarina euxinus]|uniref:STAS/SEC14 domain-containing protein n=1 Tax=Ancylomarina euxinus TaxID=2283627 RepID=A0A425Y2I6_9BACT|nr:hypothetical protein [Ancylomarina euxinus]MCZ4694947.1 hypothetical protein [Ancylomarina euxinus]MUP14813.1 hypothetical protein [Ancylomarina euxinus]RRG22157.1 hypothetical protein DWB61_08090 [Ancylomarina euxinus]